jgi:uncharacterized membrane protein YuzA (DUF378 family)
MLLEMQAFVFMISIVFIIVGALNWLAIGVAKVNVLELVFGKSSIIPRILYVIVGVSALAIMFDRDTYLPFLGPTAIPSSLIPERVPEGADTTIEVSVKPGSKVMYWAAEPATDGLKKINDWRGAYLEYMNAGVTIANQDGTAFLLVKNPQPYSVPWKGRLEPHIHFRVCQKDGLMERIQTVYMADGRVEGFVDN